MQVRVAIVVSICLFHFPCLNSCLYVWGRASFQGDPSLRLTSFSGSTVRVARKGRNSFEEYKARTHGRVPRTILSQQH